MIYFRGNASSVRTARPYTCNIYDSGEALTAKAIYESSKFQQHDAFIQISRDDHVMSVSGSFKCNINSCFELTHYANGFKDGIFL